MAARSTEVHYVQIDGLVVLKIIKHCQEEGGGGADLVQGVLLGLVTENRLEVTNCFPFPRHTEDEDFNEENYQLEMMRNLRQVNVDHLHVGWYQSTNFGTFINKAMLDSQFNYQDSIEESVVLIYDPVRTAKGQLSIKAFRLTQTMLDMYRDGDFTPDTLRKAGLSFSNMFEEVKVIIKNSHLVNAMLCEVEDMLPPENKYNFLDLATASVLEKNLRLMMDSVDDLCQDTNKYVNWLRQSAKQKQAKEQALLKRKQENEQRVRENLNPLPEDDIHKMYKMLPQPSRLDTLLLGGQISTYASQINNFTAQSFGKMFMADSLHHSSVLGGHE